MSARSEHCPAIADVIADAKVPACTQQHTTAATCCAAPLMRVAPGQRAAHHPAASKALALHRAGCCWVACHCVAGLRMPHPCALAAVHQQTGGAGEEEWAPCCCGARICLCGRFWLATPSQPGQQFCAGSQGGTVHIPPRCAAPQHRQRRPGAQSLQACDAACAAAVASGRRERSRSPAEKGWLPLRACRQPSAAAARAPPPPPPPAAAASRGRCQAADCPTFQAQERCMLSHLENQEPSARQPWMGRIMPNPACNA